MEWKTFIETAVPIIYTHGEKFFATATSEDLRDVSFQTE